jgi:hypothetical protein
MLVSFSDFRGLGEYFWGEATATLIVKTAPLFVSDVSFFSEATPFALAGVLTVIAPRSDQKFVIVSGFFLCIIGYFVYIYFSGELQAGSPLERGMENVLVDANVDQPVDVIRTFASAVRIFYLIVGASLLGLSVRKP